MAGPIDEATAPPVSSPLTKLPLSSAELNPLATAAGPAPAAGRLAADGHVGAATPLARRSRGGDDDGDEQPLQHAWKMAAPLVVAAAAAAAAASGGSAGAGEPATTPAVPPAAADAAASASSDRGRAVLGSRPSLKSMQNSSMGHSRLSRTTACVEDYVDDSYSRLVGS